MEIQKMKTYGKGLNVLFALLSVVASVAAFFPVKKAQAVRYPVLEYTWECIGCGGNCGAYVCEC